MSIFEYDELDLSATDIRLIELCPTGNYHDDLYIKLIHTSLDRHPPYHALSYTWGAPYEGLPPGWDQAECTRPISINGKEHQIRLSLDSALRHLRQMERDWTFIWIDAVCINQASMQERSHQVQLMKAIYEGAESTIIWLGPQTRDSGLAMSKISELAGSWNRRLQNEEEKYRFWADRKTKPHYHVLLKDEVGDDPDPWLAISRLFLHSWWRRAWIIQEATYSHSASIICGFDSVPWKAMMTTCMILIEHMSSLDLMEPTMATAISYSVIMARKAQRIRLFWEKVHYSGLALLPLLEVLNLLRVSDATDPRDKVYAGLGLADEYDLAVPNYNLDFHEVYAAFAKNHIEKYRNLDVLGHCYLSPDSQLNNSVPSWIPDWRISNKRMPLYKCSHSVDSKRVYSASGDTCLNFWISDDLRSLSLRGLFTDTIAITGKSLKPYASDQAIDNSYLGNDRLVEIMSVTGEWADMVESFHSSRCAKKGDQAPENAALDDTQSKVTGTKYLPTDEPLQDAFQRTMFADIRLTRSQEFAGRLVDAFSPWDRIDTDDPTHVTAMMQAIVGRKVAISESGYIGLVPEEAQEGDAICFLLGGEVPYIIRKNVTGPSLLVGECYIHGLMDGEGLEATGLEHRPLEDVVLR
jgi:hypothetical protein